VIHRRSAAIKVLFTTGYTRNAIVHNGVLDPRTELLSKPFNIEDLALKARTILDNARSVHVGLANQVTRLRNAIAGNLPATLPVIAAARCAGTLCEISHFAMTPARWFPAPAGTRTRKP
jgi:hypothetical protein